MTFWKSVLEFGPGIRFLLVGLDLKYHIWGLLEKSIIVVCVCSFSTTRYNLTDRTSSHGQTGHVGY